jgi:hypothetical protein
MSISTDDLTADIAVMLGRLRSAQRRAAAATTDEESNRPVNSWADTIRELLAIIQEIAGPAPSAVRLPDGTIVVASVSEWDNVDEQVPRLCVIASGSVVHV